MPGFGNRQVPSCMWAVDSQIGQVLVVQGVGGGGGSKPWASGTLGELFFRTILLVLITLVAFAFASDLPAASVVAVLVAVLACRRCCLSPLLSFSFSFSFAF